MVDIHLTNKIKYTIERITELEREIRAGEEAKKNITVYENELKQLMNQFIKEDKGADILA